MINSRYRSYSLRIGNNNNGLSNEESIQTFLVCFGERSINRYGYLPNYMSWGTQGAAGAAYGGDSNITGGGAGGGTGRLWVQDWPYKAGDGGRGGAVTKTYYAGAAGAPSPGSVITVYVGAGGAPGGDSRQYPGSALPSPLPTAGGNGAAYLSWY